MFWQFVEATLIFDYIILTGGTLYIYTYNIMYSFPGNSGGGGMVHTLIVCPVSSWV